jgi:DNA-binding CsgD family transcriptional regulator
VLEQRVLVAEQLRMPYFRWYAAIGMIGKALRAGSFAEAEQWIERANAIQPQSGAVTAQLITLRREQGRVDELMELIGRQRNHIPKASHIRSLRIICQLESGQRDAAREAFELMASGGFTDRFVPLRTLSWLTEACVALGDVSRAERLYDRLTPYADQNIITGSTDLTGGSVSYYLGLLATTMSRWDDAEKHFAGALAMNERWGIHPYIAHTKYAWAEMLMQCGKPGVGAWAREMVDEALALAEEIGMLRLAGQVRRLIDRLHQLRTVDKPAHGLSPREMDVLRLIVSGRSDKEIAETLSISPRTVTTHVTHILNKLGANTRTEAASLAIRAGML